VQMANSKGLSDQLSALLIQSGKVPPPLVGFVRRRQCFTNVYNGRQHMNDDMIKMLMGGTGSRVVQNKPLFFNCTEAAVPVPGENFLQGICGAQPVTISTEGAPGSVAASQAPPTGGYIPYSTTPLRTRRPDALQKDSFTAREFTYQQQAGQTGHHDHQNGGLVGHVPPVPHVPQYEQVQDQTVEELYEQYQQQREQYEQQSAQYQYEQQQHSQQQPQITQQHDQYQAQQHQAQYSQHQYQYQTYSEQQQADVYNQQAAPHSSTYHPIEQLYQPQYTDPASQTDTPQTDTPLTGEVAQQEALSAIDDDFWGLSISVQSDAALS